LENVYQQCVYAHLTGFLTIAQSAGPLKACASHSCWALQGVMCQIEVEYESTFKAT